MWIRVFNTRTYLTCYDRQSPLTYPKKYGTQNDSQPSTIVRTETRLSTTALFKVPILLLGAAEHSISLFPFSISSTTTVVGRSRLNKQTDCYKRSLLLNSSRRSYPSLQTWTLSFSWTLKEMMCVFERQREGRSEGKRRLKVGYCIIFL